MGSPGVFLLFSSLSGILPQINIICQLNIPLAIAPWAVLYSKSFHAIVSMSGTTAYFGFSCILASIGSSHPGVASQWESRNTKTSPTALSAPMSLAWVRPTRVGERISRTLPRLFIYFSSFSLR